MTVVVRLVVDRNGELDHGELVDVDGTIQGRFKHWSSVLTQLRAWIDARVAN